MITPAFEDDSGPEMTEYEARREQAFVFCFDVLASLGSMALATIASLLHPWGWTRDMLLRRIHELQNEGLVILEDAKIVNTPGNRRRASDSHIRVTLAGKQVSEAYGLCSYRLRNLAGTSEQSRRGAAPTGERPLALYPKLEVT